MSKVYFLIDEKPFLVSYVNQENKFEYFDINRNNCLYDEYSSKKNVVFHEISQALSLAIKLIRQNSTTKIILVEGMVKPETLAEILSAAVIGNNVGVYRIEISNYFWIGGHKSLTGIRWPAE